MGGKTHENEEGQRLGKRRQKRVKTRGGRGRVSAGDLRERPRPKSERRGPGTTERCCGRSVSEQGREGKTISRIVGPQTQKIQTLQRGEGFRSETE